MQNVTVELQVTIQICQPHSKLKILSRLSLYCGSCVMTPSLGAGSAIFSRSNKGVRKETARRRYSFTLTLSLIFSIYVLEMNSPSLPTRVMNDQPEPLWHKYTLVDSCRAVSFSERHGNHFYPADFLNRNGHV